MLYPKCAPYFLVALIYFFFMGLSSQSVADESEPRDNAQSAVPYPDSAPVAQEPEANLNEASRNPSSKGEEIPDIDFEHEDAFIDTTEAVRSEHYMRRAILSTIVNTTGKFEFNRLYINHLMGFSAIYQQKTGPINFTKYTSGMQGLSLGYISARGHSFDLGVEFSAVSNIYGGYRYVWRPSKISIWPYLGLGVGTEISSLKLSEGPSQAMVYDQLGGMQHMGFATVGVLIPIVEVGIKIEMRGNFYALDRLVLTQGLGLIIFL
jgi:hypothetical protein